MKQSVHLGLNQQLRMTPQLQQAIRLLQLSSLDLKQEIQECIYSNPLLEIDEAEADRAEAEAEAENPSDLAAETELNLEHAEYEYSALEAISKNPYQGAEFSERDDAAQQSLQDYLHWQLDLSSLSDIDRDIGAVIIDAIDPSGALVASIDEIIEAVGQGVDSDDVMHVLHRVQRFDPPGIGFRDLRECLLVQLELLPATGAVETAVELVQEYLEVLTKKGPEAIVRSSGRTLGEINEAWLLIRSLNPKPGYEYSPDSSDFIIPDLIVIKRDGSWQIMLNPMATTPVRLNQTYVDLVKGAGDATKEYLRSHLQEAKWLLRSLESRNETLLRVGNAILQHQSEFFEVGEEAMKPMVLRDLAEQLELHESTISRATSHKYLASPRGVIELKYFFSSQLATDSGGERSSTAIRALIHKFVKAESPAKPLSDSALEKLLRQEGIVVARRTIAKYREMLNIAPSNERKRRLEG